MSYCRFSASSDVYVFPTTGEGDEDAIVCCQCSLSGQWFRVKTPSEMIEHLNAHLKAGHRVPSEAFDRLRQEASAIESARVALSRGAEPENEAGHDSVGRKSAEASSVASGRYGTALPPISTLRDATRSLSISASGDDEELTQALDRFAIAVRRAYTPRFKLRPDDATELTAARQSIESLFGRIREERDRLIETLAYNLYSATLVGNPAPFVKELGERLQNPRVGDLVLECTMLGRPQADRTRLGKLIRVAVEPMYTPEQWWGDGGAGKEEPIPEEQVWYLKLPDGREFRWNNARFIAVPTNRIGFDTPFESDPSVLVPNAD